MIDIPKLIADGLGLRVGPVQAVLDLLDQGATVPFISRYRKEATGAMDEVAVRDIETMRLYYQQLQKRKEHVLSVIEAAGSLTPELRERIENIVDTAELEDAYLPFKPKRRTRATVAIERGLEPLARIIMAQNHAAPEKAATRFVTEDVPDAQAAIDGALDIVASWISENSRARSGLRSFVTRTGRLTAAAAKGKDKPAEADSRSRGEAGRHTERKENFRNYHSFSRPLRQVESHQFLAICRGADQGQLRWSVTVDDDAALRSLQRTVVSPRATDASRALIERAAADSYKRLLLPSIITEVMAIYKEKADKEAIKLFADNLRELLMAPPLARTRVMGVDPGFRTGCKIVCLDEQGNLLHHDVIYPCPPRSERVTSMRTVTTLVRRYDIGAIAIGNGTASRETEQFLRNLHYDRDMKIAVVSESGASIYSASEVARQEFPDHDITVRGAVSIGRRLIDPLAELVKIDPKSIGVGQYQHDVDQAALKDSLDFTVSSCVNLVGVNVNTASQQLLAYISGIGPKLAANIVAYRAEHGDFTSRSQLRDVPRLGAVAYQQSAGFLRIPGAESPLDNTAVHPESYHIVERMAADLGTAVASLVASKELIDQIQPERYVTDTVGLPTLTDIISELRRPGRDPREQVEVVEFDPNVTDIHDLRPGMELNGIVNNITAFGAFVDIGVHESGLVHISQMGEGRVQNPRDVVRVRQKVRVRVLDVDTDRCRISLTMKGVEQ